MNEIKTIADVKRAHKEKGYHFFDKETMKYLVKNGKNDFQREKNTSYEKAACSKEQAAFVCPYGGFTGSQ